MTESTEPLLEVQDLTKEFGGLVANDEVSFTIHRGEIVGLIGPNGAGKSTLFNCIAGYFAPERGTIRFDGRDLAQMRAYQVSRAGVARTFQHIKMLASLSVLENVLVGAYCKLADKAEATSRARETLRLVGISESSDRSAGDLPTAIQKRVDLARALATGPRLLMLDELMAGLNSTEVQEFIDLLRHVKREESLTLLVCEHVMDAVMQLSQRVVVLDGGRKIAEDTPAKVVNDERVIRAYLGERYAQGRGA